MQGDSDVMWAICMRLGDGIMARGRQRSRCRSWGDMLVGGDNAPASEKAVLHNVSLAVLAYPWRVCGV